MSGGNHKTGLAWFDVMKAGHPDKEVFQIFTKDREVRTERQSIQVRIQPSTRVQVGPYEVIDRVHGRDSWPHTVAGAAQPESVSVCSKRAQTSEGKGSGNTTSRVKQRAEANTVARKLIQWQASGS